jgi:hypothetical protein
MLPNPDKLGCAHASVDAPKNIPNRIPRRSNSRPFITAALLEEVK